MTAAQRAFERSLATTPGAQQARRKRPLVHLTLSPDAIARLAEIATRSGETRSGVVERLIRECEMPRLKPAGQARE